MIRGHAGEPRRGLDLKCAADGDEDVAGLGDRDGLTEHHRIEPLAEHHGGRLEDPAALQTRRVVLPGLDPGEGVLHGPARMTARTHETPCGSVQFEHLAGGHPGELVQSVDVLRDDPHRDAGLLQLGHGAMRGVRLGHQGAVLAPHLPRPPPDLRVGHVVLVRDELLRLGIPPPQTVGPAVVRDPGVRGDACTTEDRDERLRAHGAEGRRPAGGPRGDIGARRARPVRPRGCRPPARPCPRPS